MTVLLAFLLLQAEPTADETRAFMRRLAGLVEDLHLKKDPASEQRGMVYEYRDMVRKDWVQGEALDTMHDGAWFGTALAAAYHATGDPYYRTLLADQVLPFYLRMLNHSDTLFRPDLDHVHEKGHRFGREHQLQKGEKGFVPYWWDDGASASLERRRNGRAQPEFSATDRLAGKPNPGARLDGWSHGSSNHLAQDLAVLLQQAWLLLKDTHPALAAQVAEAARNLHECRMRHHGMIPMVAAAAALCTGDADLMKKVPAPGPGVQSNAYTACLAPKNPDQSQHAPGFADNEEYLYHWAKAKSGGPLPRGAAFQLVYNAYTHPMLVRAWSDTKEIPPGMNRFDLAPFTWKGGKPSPYRSEREGGFGPRMGPQNMVVSGWALQALDAMPGLWEERAALPGPEDFRVDFAGDPVGAKAVSFGTWSVRLSSTRGALLGSVSGPGTLRIGHGGAWAELTISTEGVRAMNDAGEELLTRGTAAAFEIPYTLAKGQKRWINPLELHRYWAEAGGLRRDFVLASTESQVRAALRRELAGGLLTWRAVLDEKGYLPTGIGAGTEWAGFSDSGGYAHLLKAAALWLHLR